MVAGWLFRVVLSFAVVGVLLFDTGAIAVNYLTLESTADDIANALETELESVTNRSALREHAQVLAEEARARLLKAEVDPQGVLRLRVRRPAKTLLAHRVDALKKWTRPIANAQVQTP